MAAGSFSLVAESGTYSLVGGVQASHCSDFSFCGACTLGVPASVGVAHGLSCPAAGRILDPRPGLNPCHLRWQEDSSPLDHQGRPIPFSSPPATPCTLFLI